MSVDIGTRLGSLEITALLGKGGMGEVYRATDTKLKRDVAIKILPEEFSRDPDRVSRFKREAQVLASLNHPNIAAIYDLQEADGAQFLVLELVEGETLADRITRGPIPVEEALNIAKSICEALEAAHERGIIHRDLKPANVKVTPDGKVKVLDFGLAKAMDNAPASATLSNSPTMVSGTMGGIILGTAAYMSPEQAKGRVVDRRTDIFAFGCVVYEMLAGRPAFEGEDVIEILGQVVTAEPDWSCLPSGTPPSIQRLLRRALKKDTRQRLGDIRDARLDIEESLNESPAAAMRASLAPLAPKRRSLLGSIAIGLAGLIAGGALALFLPPLSAPDLTAYKFTPITRDETEERAPEWSPDGKSIAYAARVHGVLQVFTRVVGSPDAAQLTKSEQDCRVPFWSPDGGTIYYTSGNDLWAVGASGGTAEIVLERASSAAIHPDGKTLAFGRDGKLWIGSLRGGPAREFWPKVPVLLRFAPDGSKLVAGGSGGVWLLPYPSGSPRMISARLIPPGAVSWFPDSRHLALSEKSPASTTARLFMLDVTDGSRRTIYAASDNFLSVSVSPDGKRIAYAAGETEWDVLEISLLDGAVRTLVSGGGVSWWPDFAPSGTHFLFSASRQSGGAAVEDRPTVSEGFSRRLIEGGVAYEPHWSPDGTRFVFSDVGQTRKLMLANASGGRAILLDELGPSGRLPGPSWSPDGQWISYLRDQAEGTRLAKIRATPGATPAMLANADQWPYAVTQWSPVGNWILYPAADGLVLISPDGSSAHKLTSRKFQAYNFSKDGSQVFGIFQNTSGDGSQWQLYSVNVKTGAEKFLAPVDLPASTDSVAGFSLHPDGKRFLTSIAKWPFDIWMVEGFDTTPPKNWVDRILRR